MTEEQKQRATELVSEWNTHYPEYVGDRIAALLQELVEAPEVEPALVVEVEPDYWHRGHYCKGSKPYINPLEVWKLPVGTKLYTVPPAQSEPDGWQPIETAPKDNKRSLFLARFNDDGTIQAFDYDGTWQSERESWELPQVYYYWATALGKVEEPTHWMYEPEWFSKLNSAQQPAPSVPELEEYDAGALNDFGGGNVGWWQDYIRSELGRAYEFYCGQLSAAPTPAEAPADLVQDSVASEPVGYLYTNLQSGEYHVSDYDDDYRGPERVLWCIEPVYRKTKGQS